MGAYRIYITIDSNSSRLGVNLSPSRKVRGIFGAFSVICAADDTGHKTHPCVGLSLGRQVPTGGTMQVGTFPTEIAQSEEV